jgi:enoyl-CoA hydratase/carnithine racemase
MIDIRREGPVFVLTMNAGDNRFNRTSVDALGKALDEVEGSDGPAALVTTGAVEKFYSNGLDLDWMTGDGKDEAPAFLSDLMSLFGRLLTFPIASVAAINGHVFAAGAMFSMAHDYRVMREDRGFFCLPEIDLPMPLAPGMTAVLKAKLDTRVLHDLLLTGRRVGGAEAAALHIVDEAQPADQVLPRAIERAASLSGKDRTIYRSLKLSLYGDAAAILLKGELPIKK